MKPSERVNLALKRAVGILLCTVKWPLQDVVDRGGDALVALDELVGNLLWIIITIVIGPFLAFWKAWKLRHHITKDTAWRKRRSL